MNAQHDVVIRNGRVLDGCGNPWIRVELAVDDGRLVTIGRVRGTGTIEIDAADAYVSPGWIDMMDQSGSALLENGLAHNKLHMGVTTAIGGEGGTPVGSAGIPGYLQRLQEQGLSINWGTYYGAAQARQEVLGDGDVKPDARQLQKMREHVAAAMEAGAFGIAVALIYPPASFQTTDELVALAEIAAVRGGIYATHLRDESSGLLGALAEAVEIGARAGLPVEVFHFKAACAAGWGQLMPEACAAIERARAGGVDIAANLYPYTAGGTGLSITVPSWIFAAGTADGLRQLREPKIRDVLKQQLAAGSMPGWSNLVAEAGGWDNVVLANACCEEFERFHFQSIAAIARELSCDPADVAWDIVVAAGPERRPMALFFLMSEGDIETALRMPWTSIGSDGAVALAEGGADALGLPHPRSYGTFPRVIAEYVRRRGVLTLPDAIRKMTSWPAARMGLSDRGVIREGSRADLTVFDFGSLDDRASWSEPTARPLGIRHVLVNGVPVVANGRHTGARPGQVLRGRGFKPESLKGTHRVAAIATA
jgi:N-acyl-D-amino-acid deacylase